MATKTVNWKMKQRQGTASQWASKNPVLAAGEFGYDTTNDVVKIGDGKTAWLSLPSFRKKKYDLDSLSWAEIAEIAKAGRAACVFNIGDEKTITLSTGEKITLVILGFFHDTYYDSEYDEDTSYTITFGMKNCLATRYQMNASNTNVGGWESSKMRTSVMPTLLSQLPADLQSVIKSVYKKHRRAISRRPLQQQTINCFCFRGLKSTGQPQQLMRTRANNMRILSVTAVTYNTATTAITRTE